MHLSWRTLRTGVIAAMAVAALGVAPAAAVESFPPDGEFEPLPEDGFFGPDAGELFEFPEVPDPSTFTYPPEYDPSLPHIEIDFLGIAYNSITAFAYDPGFPGFDGGLTPIEVDLRTGESVIYETGVQGPRVPLDVFSFGAADFLDTEPQAETEPATDPVVDEPEPAEPATSGRPGPGDRFDEFVDADPILIHYRDDTPIDELGEFAIEPGALPDAAIAEALRFTAYEIALLFELEAFNRGTPWYDTFAEIHAAFAPWDDADRRQLIDTLAAVDLEFQSRSQLFGRELTNDQFHIMWAVNDIPTGFYEELGDGTWAFLNGFEYAAGLLRLMASAGQISVVPTAASNIALESALTAALEALDVQQDLNGLLRLELDELRAAVAELANPSLDGLVSDAAGADGDALLYGGIAAAGVVLLLGAGFVAVRRRRRGRGPANDDAMTTTQLLAGARDEAEIVEILRTAGPRLVGSALELFHATSDGLRRAGEAPIVVASDLQRVVDTGQRSMPVLDDDPAFPGEVRAVLALPVIHGGRVQAVLVAHRLGDEPFTADDRHALEPIAPGLGGTLERATELGTMSKLAMVDGLTALGNRRRLDGDLETNLANAVAGELPLGFAMIDVDHFKTYNDTHGHTAGDEVLRKVADTIARCVRETDIVYRYGGEEFSMLLPGATPDDAAHVAERVRMAVEAEEFPGEEHQPGGRLTVSVGVATLASGTAGDIRERADQALYAAKAGGRNQVGYG